MPISPLNLMTCNKRYLYSLISFTLAWHRGSLLVWYDQPWHLPSNHIFSYQTLDYPRNRQTKIILTLKRTTGISACHRWTGSYSKEKMKKIYWEYNSVSPYSLTSDIYLCIDCKHTYVSILWPDKQEKRSLLDVTWILTVKLVCVPSKGKNNGLGTGSHFFSKVLPGSLGFWMNREPFLVNREPLLSNQIKHNILRVK